MKDDMAVTFPRRTFPTSDVSLGTSDSPTLSSCHLDLEYKIYSQYSNQEPFVINIQD